ncbi:universal stress protein [Kineosporia babensis]|uniref:Universal stress protein n=1 Tax=Kineosporia babensis TaxID=499548 RepID=A0A9X1NA77_9ACTN|nr:universal stress protein [Kineosporia babensis]MCD5309576.1 universal stress protein [Kineosporia babensis]
MTTNRIVVGVDGSTQSAQALRWAAQQAVRSGATLRAVTAWELPTTYAWASWPIDWDPARDARRVLTETIAKTFEGHPPVELEEVVREGGAARILIDEARFATTVVVGSRGHGRVAGVLLGSVSTKVSEHATCPVVVVHGDQRPETAQRKEGTLVAG